MGGKFSLCQPARAGSAVGLLTGLTVWALVSFIPAFHSGVPEPVVAVIPVALAWFGHTAAAWVSPHPAAAPAPAAPAAPTPSVPGGGTSAVRVITSHETWPAAYAGTEGAPVSAVRP